MFPALLSHHLTGIVPAQVCVAAGTHQALVASLATALLLLLATAAWAGVVYRKTRALDLKNRSLSSSYL